MFVEKGFEPLAELKIVLISCLDEFGDINMSFHSVFVERTLQDLVIFNELVFMFSLPLYATELERAREQAIHHTAVDSRSRALLDLRDPQIKQLVQPLNKDLLAYEVGFVHHAN